MDRKEKAADIFNRHEYNCCQTVVSVFAEEFGLDRQTALNLSMGFGGGLHKGEVCGAVSGAVMALGLKIGCKADDRKNPESMPDTRIEDFLEKFKERNGAITCRDLLGQDLSALDKEEVMKLLESGVFQKSCLKAVIDAVILVEDILKI